MKKRINFLSRWQNAQIVAINTLLFLILFSISFKGMSQIIKPTAVLASEFDVKELCRTPWDDSTGLPYIIGPGQNLGTNSFARLNDSSFAFLANASNEIIKIDIKSGKVISSFNVAFAPRDFVFDEDKFFVLTETEVFIYNIDGIIMGTIPFSKSIIGVERIEHVKGVTYLLLPSGNSLVIGNNLSQGQIQEIPGFITYNEIFERVSITGLNTYEVTLFKSGREIVSGQFNSDLKIGSIIPIGIVDDVIFIDLQLFKDESKMLIERKIIALKFENNSIKYIAELEIPMMYYVWTNKDFLINKEGLFQMVTTPNGAYVFKLNVSLNGSVSNKYPYEITSTQYHYNEHTSNEN